jgi:hypothetical protein
MASKILLIFIFALLLIGLGSGQPASNQISITNQLIIMAIFIFLLLLFAAAPIILNMYWAYGHLSKTQEILKEIVGKQKENKIENEALIHIVENCINAQPSGVTGIGRSTMALTLTVILGISLIYLFVYPPSAEVSTIIKDLLLTVIGAIASIIGFYFGGRALQESAAQPSIAPATQPSIAPSIIPTEVNMRPSVISLIPDNLSPQKAGTTVTWTAGALDPEGDPILYKFFLKGPSTKNQLVAKTFDWVRDNKWAWATTEEDVGINLIEVRVRDGKHAGPEGYDSNMIESYQVQPKENVESRVTY